MPLPDGDVDVDENEPALKAEPRTNPDFAMRVRPRRATAVSREPGNFLDMAGGDYFAGELGEFYLHLPPAGRGLGPPPSTSGTWRETRAGPMVRDVQDQNSSLWTNAKAASSLWLPAIVANAEIPSFQARRAFLA